MRIELLPLPVAALLVLMASGTLPASASSPTGQGAGGYSARSASIARPYICLQRLVDYDELSDNIPLTETLAMKELEEILRLRKSGVRFDYCMMDTFWFDRPVAGTWRKPNWPRGPAAWIDKCCENGIP